MTDTPLSFAAVRKLFPHAGKVVYFNAASFGPFCTPVADAVKENVDIRLASEKDDSHDSFDSIAELHGLYAGLVGATPESIGLGLNTSFGLNLAAFGLPLKSGDEVLVSDVEFPAVVYAFREAAVARGLKLKFIPSVNRCFSIDAFERAITKQTRVLALSFVQFFNGFKNDLETISAICKKHSIWFVVDGIQGMGSEPIDVRKLGIDVFSSGCQKWMLAPQGCGFFYLSDNVRDLLYRTHASWLDVDWQMQFTDLFKYDMPVRPTAERFSLGYYVVFNILGMKAAALIFRDLGTANIQRHNYGLIDRLAAYLRQNPFYVITSSMEPKHRSSIFTFSCANLEKLHSRLLKNKIVCVRREGSIRISVHLYNDESDIDRLIEQLEAFTREN